MTVGAERLQRLRLDPGGDVQRLHLAELMQAVRGAPAQEFAGGAPVGVTGVAVADIGGEEIKEAARGGCTAGGDQGGQPGRGGGRRGPGAAGGWRCASWCHFLNYLA